MSSASTTDPPPTPPTYTAPGGGGPLPVTSGAVAPFTPEQMAWLSRHLPGPSSAPDPLSTAASTSGAPLFMPVFSAASTGGGTHLSWTGGMPPTTDPPTTTSALGVSLIPPKVVTRILKYEYIDMRELLSESWQAEEGTSTCCQTTRPKKGALITDITIWTECYSLLVAVLVTRHPDKAGHFMAYLRTIVKASRNYGETAWASYDAAYRRKAANERSLDWGIIDSTLFSEAFTGRAKVIARCQYCLSDTHLSSECPHGPGEDARPAAKVPKYSPPLVLAQPPKPQAAMVQLCGKFNQKTGNNCTFHSCRYAHICSNCRRGPHPASECNSFTRGRGSSGGRPLLNIPPQRQ